jgi:hypothetical protein
MTTIDEFVLKNIGLWWRYGISRHCDEWKYIIIGRIFESEIILIPPTLKISESSSNGSYRNTDEVWWRYGISRSCDEWKRRSIHHFDYFLSGHMIILRSHDQRTPDYFLGVDRDWIECKDRQLWVEIVREHVNIKLITNFNHRRSHSLSRVVVPATLHNISVNAHFTRCL